MRGERQPELSTEFTEFTSTQVLVRLSKICIECTSKKELSLVKKVLCSASKLACRFSETSVFLHNFCTSEASKLRGTLHVTAYVRRMLTYADVCCHMQLASRNYLLIANVC